MHSTCLRLLAFFFILLVVARPAGAQGLDLLHIVNGLRAPGGACAGASEPIRQNPWLDTAAARVAGGATLEAAIKASGYRASQAQLITLTGAMQRARVESLLASRFCAQIGNARLTDVGLHTQGPRVWIVLAAPFAPQAPLTRGQLADRMLSLVNTARAAPRNCGDKPFAAAPALGWNATLEQAASAHAGDMARNNYFSHTARDGSSPAQRVSRAGYGYRMTGENIAGGQQTAEAAVAGWIKSPGHCANLMHPGYTDMGVAVAVDAGSRMGIYWVQLFGTPR